MKTGNATIDKVHRDFLDQIIEELGKLDATDPSTLVITTRTVILVGHSQAEVASAIDMSRPTISRWCSGSRNLPRSSIARKALVGALIDVLRERRKRY